MLRRADRGVRQHPENHRGTVWSNDHRLRPPRSARNDAQLWILLADAGRFGLELTSGNLRTSLLFSTYRARVRWSGYAGQFWRGKLRGAVASIGRSAVSLRRDRARSNFWPIFAEKRRTGAAFRLGIYLSARTALVRIPGD